MALLKFLKGDYARLNNAAINEGQILVCGDTGELFVDVAADKRVKVGDFTVISNLAALEALDATSVPTSRLYYVEDGNILARSNGTTWVQVNRQKTKDEMIEFLGLQGLAYKSEVAEGDLNAELAAKINAASGAQHTHANKTVLDGITAERVAAWDASEQNAKDYADGLDEAMDTRVKAVEAAIGENGSVAGQIKTAIEALDYTDTAVDGEYVSAVNEVDGKISVTRKALPDYTNTYDAKGAAATALDNAKAYADGLAANYDEKGAAAGVKTELEAEIAKKVAKTDYEADKATFATKTELGDVDKKFENYRTSADQDVIDNGHKERIEALEAKFTGDNSVDAKIAAAVDVEKQRAEGIEGGLRTDVDAVAGRMTTAEGKITALEGASATHATKDELNGVDAKFANYKTAADQKVIDDEQDRRLGVIEGDYLKAADIANFETKENVKKVADDLAAYVESNDEALAGVKATAEAARTEDEVNSQIDAKITALNLGTTYEPIGAEDRAKAYVDGKFTDANLAQYTTEQEVKDIVDGVITGAVDGDTITGLANLVEYLNTHGTEAKEMGAAIDVLEGKVETIEGKPAYGITATQISNWDGEVGAKALAETKTTTAEVKNQIEAYGYATTGYADGKANDAKDAAIADAATKYETIGTAQGIVDGLKLAETYEPIGAEGRAIAAAKTETENQVKALADTVYTQAEVDALIQQAHSWGEF